MESNGSDKGIHERFFACPPEPTWWNLLPLVVSQVGYARWPRGHSHGRTFYKDLGVALVTSGNAIFRQDADEFLLEPGMVMIRLPGHSHHWTTGPAGYLHTRFIHFVGPNLSLFIKSLKLDTSYIAKITDASAATRLLRDAGKTAAERKPGFSLELSLIGYRLLAQVAHDCMSFAYPPQILSLIEYLQRNIHQAISIDDMTGYLAVSRAQLFRLCRLYLKKSPHAYFNGIRLEYARNMLSTGRHTVKQVALSLRYTDPFVFSKQFKRHFGYHPNLAKQGASPRVSVDMTGNFEPI